MAKNVDLQVVIKHILDGSFGDSLCRICLHPLAGFFEDIFTKVCKEDKEYCIADVLKEICQVKISPEENYKVCSDCFLEASSAYKFYLLSKRSEEILNYYIDELEQHVSSIDVPEECSSDSICIKMPIFTPNTEIFDYNLIGIQLQNKKQNDTQNHNTTIIQTDKETIPTNMKIDNESASDSKSIKLESIDDNDLEDKIVIVMNEDSEPSFFKADEDGSFIPITKEEVGKCCKDSDQPTYHNDKKRRKRNRMDYKSCSQCPVKYRFVAKLKEHMKTDHNIDIFVCKVCKAIIEDEQEFNNHLRTHTNIHRCSICNAVFKKRETIIAHFRSHEAVKELSKAQGARVCEICGWILKDEDSLKEHYEDKHVKKYTCFYCGRRYKGEVSFELHIKKHEAHLSVKQKSDPSNTKDPSKDKQRKRNFTCKLCSKNFVDERSLMWHERLHRDERPYVCEVCGRGFVSVNRRNQHAVCAHTPPARRCPLCPALFHLRSMVNSHIKKVHLQAHKRRNRITKHQNVFWRTEPVPFQELSVAVQTDILEMKTAKREAREKAESALYGVEAISDFNNDDQFLEKYCSVNPVSPGVASSDI